MQDIAISQRLVTELLPKLRVLNFSFSALFVLNGVDRFHPLLSQTSLI